MSKREYSICIDCKHQDGTWVNDCEVDTWCKLGKTRDCDETFECEYFEKYMSYKIL